MIFEDILLIEWKFFSFSKNSLLDFFYFSRKAKKIFQPAKIENNKF